MVSKQASAHGVGSGVIKKYAARAAEQQQNSSSSSSSPLSHTFLASLLFCHTHTHRYARLRRDSMTKDACTVAAHIAFIHADSPEYEGLAATTNISAAASSTSSSSSSSSTSQVDARHCFALLSARVYINVHHDFELEPEMMLQVHKSKHPQHPSHLPPPPDTCLPTITSLPSSSSHTCLPACGICLLAAGCEGA